jgi:hypothetical protein
MVLPGRQLPTPHFSRTSTPTSAAPRARPDVLPELVERLGARRFDVIRDELTAWSIRDYRRPSGGPRRPWWSVQVARGRRALFGRETRPRARGARIRRRMGGPDTSGRAGGTRSAGRRSGTVPIGNARLSVVGWRWARPRACARHGCVSRPDLAHTCGRGCHATGCRTVPMTEDPGRCPRPGTLRTRRGPDRDAVILSDTRYPIRDTRYAICDTRCADKPSSRGPGRRRRCISAARWLHRPASTPRPACMDIPTLAHLT